MRFTCHFENIFDFLPAHGIFQLILKTKKKVMELLHANEGSLTLLTKTVAEGLGRGLARGLDEGMPDFSRS